MRLSTLVLVVLVATVPICSKAQHVDAGLLGNWKLSVEKSTFGPDGAPSAGTVRWTQHGWAVALAFPNGYLYTDAVITDHGCALIGVPDDFTCSIAVLSPTHVRFTLKQGRVPRRVGDIELTDRDTTRTVHHVTPETGDPYTETTIWIRDRE
jgi:hypothetical protein